MLNRAKMSHTTSGYTVVFQNWTFCGPGHHSRSLQQSQTISGLNNDQNNGKVLKEITLQVAAADNWVLNYIFTTGIKLLEMLSQRGLGYSEVPQLQLQNLCLVMISSNPIQHSPHLRYPELHYYELGPQNPELSYFCSFPPQLRYFCLFSSFLPK